MAEEQMVGKEGGVDVEELARRMGELSAAMEALKTGAGRAEVTNTPDSFAGLAKIRPYNESITVDVSHQIRAVAVREHPQPFAREWNWLPAMSAIMKAFAELAPDAYRLLTRVDSAPGKTLMSFLVLREEGKTWDEQASAVRVMVHSGMERACGAALREPREGWVLREGATVSRGANLGVPIELMGHKIHATEMTIKGRVKHDEGNSTVDVLQADALEAVVFIPTRTPYQTIAITDAVEAMTRATMGGVRFPIRTSLGQWKATLLEWTTVRTAPSAGAKVTLRLDLIPDDPSAS